MPAPESLYERLRKLAVEDPAEAKKVVLETFDSNSTELSEFLIRLRKPNEGRLRQVVANAVRTHPEKSRIVSELLLWRETETDEFTRRAIEGSLAGVDPEIVREGKVRQRISAPSELADVYRYVSERLKHRLRNTMLPLHGHANRLKKLMAVDPSADVQTTIAKLNDAMVSLGRDLEAVDVDPDHFRQRSIVLADWLVQLNLRYAPQYDAVSLRLIDNGNAHIRIFANDYLLETIFWNIWLNAQQATGLGCEIIVEFQVVAHEITLLISDNGEGFPGELKDVVFQQVFSTKNQRRGRGLLEIQDAVERLAGRVELYEAKSSEYRIRICLPQDVQ